MPLIQRSLIMKVHFPIDSLRGRLPFSLCVYRQAIYVTTFLTSNFMILSVHFVQPSGLMKM
jgi:hypothetical protein